MKTLKWAAIVLAAILILGGANALGAKLNLFDLSGRDAALADAQSLADDLIRERRILRAELGRALGDSEILRSNLAEAESRLSAGAQRLRAVGEGLRSGLAESEQLVSDSGEIVAGIEHSLRLARAIRQAIERIEGASGGGGEVPAPTVAPDNP